MRRMTALIWTMFLATPTRPPRWLQLTITPTLILARMLLGVSADMGDFDMSGLDISAGQDDDFTAFGTGLSQTGETDDATLYAAMQPVLEDLATEVRRSLEFHLGRYPDTTFSRLVLVGGGAKLRNLDEFLAGSLGVPTSVGDPFAHIKVNVPGLPNEFAPTNAPLCAVALGLRAPRVYRVNRMVLI